MNVLLNLLLTALTLATGVTLIYVAGDYFGGGGWVSFSIGLIGAGIIIALLESIWRSDE